MTGIKLTIQGGATMKILLIGGTGTISTAITAKLHELGHDLTLLNRGKRNNSIQSGVEVITADINNESEIATLLDGRTFDAVADFIAFDLPHIERDYRLFSGITKQYIFISSASAYQKPPVDPVITESTPLTNPYWEYSRNKAKCEEWLIERFREDGFPVTIVRPSHTYYKESVPVALHGHHGSWQVLKRMIQGKPVIIPGDGSSLWTLTHSTDFAKGFIGLLGNPHAIGQAVHITSDESLTWTQIHEIIAAELGVKLNPLYVPTDLLTHAGKKFGYDFVGSLTGDKSCTVLFDNSKVKRLVPDFVASTRFDQGAAEVIGHVLSRPELQKEDLEFDTFCDEVDTAMKQVYTTFS